MRRRPTVAGRFLRVESGSSPFWRVAKVASRLCLKMSGRMRRAALAPAGSPSKRKVTGVG